MFDEICWLISSKQLLAVLSGKEEVRLVSPT